MSASLWGCELKFPRPWMYLVVASSASLWGCELKWLSNCSFRRWMPVSLLVRLWVEIHSRYRQPKPEAVSLLVRLWVEMFCVVLSNGMSWVSLLVRLWVEIVFAFMCSITLFQSASLWGCELKCACTHVYRGTLPSASLWGCELKYQDRSGINIVSVSASLWGCELKCSLCDHRYMSYLVSLLVRLWVEIIVSFIPSKTDTVSLLVRLWVEITGNNRNDGMFGQPPCEAVSWNNAIKSKISKTWVSLLVRLWVEMAWWKPFRKHNYVSLLVRLWVEIFNTLIRFQCSFVSLLVRLWVEIPF